MGALKRFDKSAYRRLQFILQNVVSCMDFNRDISGAFVQRDDDLGILLADIDGHLVSGPLKWRLLHFLNRNRGSRGSRRDKLTFKSWWSISNAVVDKWAGGHSR